MATPPGRSGTVIADSVSLPNIFILSTRHRQVRLKTYAVRDPQGIFVSSCQWVGVETPVIQYGFLQELLGPRIPY